MDERLKKTIVLASLGAFAMETYEFALQGKTSHAMPSALQVAPATLTSTSVEVFWTNINLGNAATEAVYPNVADSQALKHDGQTLPIPPDAGPQ